MEAMVFDFSCNNDWYSGFFPLSNENHEVKVSFGH